MSDWESLRGTYQRIDPVALAARPGVPGAPRWEFTLWCTFCSDEDRLHRSTLERFAAAWPEASLSLPAFEPEEDCVEGRLIWRGQAVRVWYETLLNFLSLQSGDRATLEAVREALVPFAPVKPG